MQATGNMWTWAIDRGGEFSTGGWNGNTEGFGSEYEAPNVSQLGGAWDNNANAGSRSSYWKNTASFSYYNIGLRLVCDHLRLD
jgi:hypothetical protein